MIAFLIARGLSPLFAKLIAYVGIPLLVALFLWWRVDAFGDRRFNQGVEAHRAEVRKATEELRAAAARSATQADDAATARFTEHLQQTSEERERLNEAAQTGSSPLDVLFGG